MGGWGQTGEMEKRGLCPIVFMIEMESKEAMVILYCSQYSYFCYIYVNWGGGEGRERGKREGEREGKREGER